jgi:hypothetical protein
MFNQHERMDGLQSQRRLLCNLNAGPPTLEKQSHYLQLCYGKSWTVDVLDCCSRISTHTDNPRYYHASLQITPSDVQVRIINMNFGRYACSHTYRGGYVYITHFPTTLQHSMLLT